MLQYYLFFKPYQVLSQFSPEGDKTTLSHFFQDLPKDVYPVGRLDYDSEGLLLLTNDKQLTHRLLEPKFAHQRTYLVQVEGHPDEMQLQQLREGVMIRIQGKDHQTAPAIVQLLDEAPLLPPRNPPIRFRKSVPDAWLQLTLTEGRNRQVRRMTAAVGLPTLRLVRYSIGHLTIEGLQPGSFRRITKHEIVISGR